MAFVFLGCESLPANKTAFVQNSSHDHQVNLYFFVKKNYARHDPPPKINQVRKAAMLILFIVENWKLGCSLKYSTQYQSLNVWLTSHTQTLSHKWNVVLFLTIVYLRLTDRSVHRTLSDWKLVYLEPKPDGRSFRTDQVTRPVCIHRTSYKCGWEPSVLNQFHKFGQSEFKSSSNEDVTKPWYLSPCLY